jgi:hypothetical protein
MAGSTYEAAAIVPIEINPPVSKPRRLAVKVSPAPTVSPEWGCRVTSVGSFIVSLYGRGPSPNLYFISGQLIGQGSPVPQEENSCGVAGKICSSAL